VIFASWNDSKLPFVALQVYLTCITLSRFLNLSQEKRRSRKRYIYFLLLTLILSVVRFVFYCRDRTSVLDSPGIQIIDRVYGVPVQELAISFGVTGLLWMVGDAFLVS
jgi:small neutral amino acid transporter SnatA (MarC family)